MVRIVALLIPLLVVFPSTAARADASMGMSEDDAAAGRALARTMRIGGVSGLVAVVGLSMAIRGQALRVDRRLTLCLGPGSLGVHGSF